jgi:D-glycero-D-manno-heptose 1,7-bisphosphate phosphatase
VDRDGTLNVDLHYIDDPRRLDLYRGVGRGIQLLHQHGFRVVVVTNQSGVARKLYTEATVHALHERLKELLAREGTYLDAIYYCPHAPEDKCACRKPGVELFRRAEKDLHLHLPSSAIIGDRFLDVEAGRQLGLLTALVPEPGHEATYAAERAARPAPPDLEAPDFLSACHRLLARG